MGSSHVFDLLLAEAYSDSLFLKTGLAIEFFHESLHLKERERDSVTGYVSLPDNPTGIVFIEIANCDKSIQ